MLMLIGHSNLKPENKIIIFTKKNATIIISLWVSFYFTLYWPSTFFKFTFYSKSIQFFLFIFNVDFFVIIQWNNNSAAFIFSTLFKNMTYIIQGNNHSVAFIFSTLFKNVTYIQIKILPRFLKMLTKILFINKFNHI